MAYLDEKKNRVMGCIFGEAIGDALGHPIEFRKTHKVVQLEKDNQFTDDTQMFSAVGEALLTAPPHKDEDAFMNILSQNFMEWRKNPLGGSHRAPGGNCMEAVRRLGALRGEERPWLLSGGTDFKGNGTAMRSGIIGAYYWKNPEYAFRIGGLSSVPTHYNLESILGAGAIAYLTAAGIAGLKPAQAVSNLLLLASRWMETEVVPHYPENVALGDKWEEQSPWYALAMWGAGFALSKLRITPGEAVRQLNFRKGIRDGVVTPAVSEVIYFSGRNVWAKIPHDDLPEDYFRILVLDAVNYSHDTDTIGAMTGTVLGSRVGIDQIPQEWVQGVEMSSYFRDLGDRIFDASSQYEVPTAKTESPVDDIFDDVQF